MQTSDLKIIAEDILNNIVDDVVDDVVSNIETTPKEIEPCNNPHCKCNPCTCNPCKCYSNSHINNVNLHKIKPCSNIKCIIDSRFGNIVFYSMIVGFISVLPSFYYLYNN